MDELKKRIIDKILDNKVYMPDSKMRIGAARALSRLSKIALQQIETIVACKK